jgi:hypothetical protein
MLPTMFQSRRFFRNWPIRNNNCLWLPCLLNWWQKSDIWSQASYRYPILWEAFLDPSDSYFLFVDFYTHLTYICICTFFVTFFSATIDDRNLIFGHKLHIHVGMKVGKQEVGIWWVQKLFPWYGVPIWSLWPNIRSLPSIVAEKNVRPSKIFFVAFFSATINGRNLIFGHKFHIGTPYRGKCFWTRQIPTSCLPT